MRKILKLSVALVLVLSMIVSMGLSSYTAEFDDNSDSIVEVVSEGNEEQSSESVTDSENLEGSINPVESADSEEPVEQEGTDSEEPIVPEETENTNEPTVDPENPGTPPINSEIPQSPVVVNMLNYKIVYFLDGIEQIEWEINDQVPIDNPIIEVVPHDYMAEGYTIDEDLSTALPFVVTESENVIEVYYINVSVKSVSLMANSNALNYTSTSAVFPLYDTSTNDQTNVKLAWYDGNDLYIAFISHQLLLGIEYNNNPIPSPGIFRAPNQDDYLNITDRDGLSEEYHISDYYPGKIHPQFRWYVVNIGEQTLTASFYLRLFMQGDGGHGVGTTINVVSDLQVYHSYEGNPTIFDIEQSGNLSSSFGYSLYPIYEYDGELYELEMIEVEHNGLLQPYLYPSDLVGGYLIGAVTPIGFNASAKITFIYKKAADGELTITKYVNGSHNNQEFDIFIYGPNDKVYVVTLHDGESATLTGLEYGEYRVEETVPMNYKLVGMTSGGIVTINKTNKYESVTVTNERTNDGWFWDDDVKINSFAIGESSQSSLPIRGRTMQAKLEFFLIPLSMEIDNKSDNV